MRWDNLFDDLESQLEGEMRAEESDLLVEEERLRRARLSLRERLVALTPRGVETRSTIRLILTSGRTLDLVPSTIGRDWVSGRVMRDAGIRGHGIVPFGALQSVVLTREQIARTADASGGPEEEARGGGPSRDGLSARLGLGYVLRDLCRRRSAVDIALVSGGTVHGTIDRVGRDHLDLAVHEPGVPRREREVSHYRLVPLGVIETVRMG
jgi:hypothetical protein